MPERRMFAKTIVLSDAFLDMPLGARCLYMTMGMLADDDGFVNSPKSIMRQCGASEDDLKVLITKKFIIPFDNGIIVIKHWRINNYLRSDRYQETVYLEQKGQLAIDEKGAYTTDGIPTVGIPRLDKDSTGKDRLYKKDIPPTLEDVQAYCKERKNNVDPEAFVDFYTAKGWKVGNQPMKDWKACVRTWEKREEREKSKKPRFTADEMEVEEQDIDELRRQLFGDDWKKQLYGDSEDGNSDDVQQGV